MNFNKLLIVPFLALAVTACGNDCKSACEDGNECPGVTTKDDCDKTCDDAEKFAEDADCSDQYDDAASCMADQDVCKADSLAACASEFSAYSKCITPYCMKNPNASGCGLADTGDGT